MHTLWLFPRGLLFALAIFSRVQTEDFKVQNQKPFSGIPKMGGENEICFLKDILLKGKVDRITRSEQKGELSQ